MPQFDTFSFFSQLFWVFFGFGYLYLVLCFYVLPSFAAVLKVRAKKIATKTDQDNGLEIISGFSSFFNNNSVFFEFLSRDLFIEPTQVNSSVDMFNPVVLNNEASSKLNSWLLTDYKIVQAFY